jgi:hypothetical protein
MHVKRGFVVLIRYSLLIAGAFSLVVVFVFGQEPSDKGNTELAWKFKKGQKLEYEMKWQDEKISDGPVRAILEVLDIDKNGVTTIAQKYSSIKSEAAGKTVFDSAKKEDIAEAKKNPEMKILPAMLDKLFSLKIDRNGLVTEVKGYDELAMEIFKDSKLESFTVALLMERFSDRLYQRIYEGIFPILPKGKVKKGDSWPAKIGLPALAPDSSIWLECKLTFQGMEKMGNRSCAKIVTELTNINHHYKHATITSKECSGVYYFDTTEGVLVKSERKISLTIKSTMYPDDPKAPYSTETFSQATFMELKEPLKETPK